MTHFKRKKKKKPLRCWQDEPSFAAKQTSKPITQHAEEKEAKGMTKMIMNISSSPLMIMFVNHLEVDLKMNSNTNPTYRDVITK